MPTFSFFTIVAIFICFIGRGKMIINLKNSSHIVSANIQIRRQHYNICSKNKYRINNIMCFYIAVRIFIDFCVNGQFVAKFLWIFYSPSTTTTGLGCRFPSLLKASETTPKGVPTVSISFRGCTPVCAFVQ